MVRILCSTVPKERPSRGDVATIVEHHAAPDAGIEPGYSVEVCNTSGETFAVLTLPESLWSRCAGRRF